MNRLARRAGPQPGTPEYRALLAAREQALQASWRTVPERLEQQMADAWEAWDAIEHRNEHQPTHEEIAAARAYWDALAEYEAAMQKEVRA